MLPTPPPMSKVTIGIASIEISVDNLFSSCIISELLSIHVRFTRRLNSGFLNRFSKATLNSSNFEETPSSSTRMK